MPRHRLPQDRPLRIASLGKYDLRRASMPMYVPKYRDHELLRDLLDYVDIEVPDTSEVEETASNDRGRHLGLGGHLDAGIDRQRRVERREAFSRVARLGGCCPSGSRPAGMNSLIWTPIPPLPWFSGVWFSHWRARTF